MSFNREIYGHTSLYCHMCKSKKLSLVVDLGFHPHSDDFLSPDRLHQVEHYFPLRLVSCEECGLLQVDYFVNPKILYQTNYIYESSITSEGVSHYRSMAKEIASRFKFKKNSLVIDIGSNVGVLLTGFKEEGYQVLGIDPAETVAKKAIANGIDTIIDFFTIDIAKKIKNDKSKANIITGTNVFAHLHHLDEAVEAMRLLLNEKGIIVIEAPYAMDMISSNEYDTIYHQHISYLSVRPMKNYFNRFGLELFNVESAAIHGGSLRYFVAHKGVYSVSDTVQEYIDEEKRFGLYSKDKLVAFKESVQKQRRELIDLLTKLKAEGKSIVGVSAPAKGNTLLNYCKIDTQYIDFITEKSSMKQGLYTPGTHIPIFHDKKLLDIHPDYAIILAWNFADEIMKNLADFKKQGGRFILPIPSPVVIE